MKSFHRQSPLAAASLFLLSSTAFAQDEDVETVYVTGARVALATEDATASITRLDETAIEARGGLFVADILRTVPGLAVSRSGAPGALTQIRARGSEANHVLVLIDGVEASNPFTGEADFAHFAFDDLGAIEVARGEQSAVWGADAIGGVIHLSTARPDTGQEMRLRAEAGSRETRRLSGRIAGRGEQGWWSASAGAYESEGFDVSGQGGEADGYANRTASIAAARDLGDNVTFDAALRWVGFESDYDSDTDFDGRLNDVDRSSEGENVFARLSLTGLHDMAGIAFEHEGAVQLTDTLSETYSGGARNSRALGQRLQGHYQITGRWSHGAAEHRLTGLVEHDRDRIKAFDGAGAGSNQTRTIETDALAFDYGLDWSRADLSLSARHDANELFEDATTWRAGAGWAFETVGGRLRASYGEGVKNPGVYELFGFFPDFFVGNPDLVPESSKGWEIGWDQELAGGDAGLSLVYFSSVLEDEIYTDFGVFPATARNATSDSERSGFELAGQWQIDPDLRLFGSLTLLDSEQDGAPEIRRPEELASLTLDWRPEGRALSGALTVDYTGEQGDTDFGTFQPVVLDAYTLVGGQLRWAANESVEVYVRAENLFDEEYQDVFGYHTPGRGLYLGLRLGAR